MKKMVLTKNITKNAAFLLCIVVLCSLLLTCTEIVFDNPWDPNGIHDGRPIICLNEPLTMIVVKNDDFIDPGYIIKDEKDGLDELLEKLNITAVTEDEDTIPLDNLTQNTGVFFIHYYIEDSDGKKADTSRTVMVKEKDEVKDTIAPVISLEGEDIAINLGETFIEPGFSVIDNPGKEVLDTSEVRKTAKRIIGDVEEIVPLHIFYKRQGDYLICYTATDKSGNRSEEVRRKVVIGPDIESPVITLKGQDTVSILVRMSYRDSGATARDNVMGDLTDDLEIENTVDTSKAGKYHVQYCVSDTSGNESSKRRIVYVRNDTIPPRLDLRGPNPMTVHFKSIYHEPGATAEDNVDGDITDNIKISGNVNLEKVGKYIVSYSVSDKDGNKTEKQREVIVNDTVAPVVKLNPPNPVLLSVGFPYTEPGATAHDNADGDLTDKIDISGDVNTDVIGVYKVTYTVSDKSGNQTVEKRTVSVVPAPEDTIPPKITLKGSNPMQVYLGQPYNEPGATANDNLDGDLTSSIKISGNVDTMTTGTYYVVYRVSDKAGNNAVATRTVVVYW